MAAPKPPAPRHKPRPRLLTLGAYPVAQPRHGGQVRLAQLARAYRAVGFEVRQASCFPDQAGYLELGLWPGDIPLPHPQLQAWQGMAGPYVESAAAGDWAAAQPAVLERLEDHAGRVQVLHLEQPWLWPVVQALAARGRIGPFSLVYGSQNIEHHMLQPLWQQHAAPQAAVWTAALKQREIACVQAARLVAAVTEADQQALQAWARPGTAVHLAPNGIQPWRACPSAVVALRERLQREWAVWSGPKPTDGVPSLSATTPPYALYVASDHPPNVQGFADCFGASLAGLPPGLRVVVAGRAGPALQASAWFAQHAGINRSRLYVTGPVSESELSAWREGAAAYLLCVTGGGGSNLKTAEALYSGRPVVATEMALRGFEGLLPWPGLVVAQPGPAFVEAVAKALLRSPIANGPADLLGSRPSSPSTPSTISNPNPDPRRERLTWAQCLQPWAQTVRALAGDA